MGAMRLRPLWWCCMWQTQWQYFLFSFSQRTVHSHVFSNAKNVQNWLIPSWEILHFLSSCHLIIPFRNKFFEEVVCTFCSVVVTQFKHTIHVLQDSTQEGVITRDIHRTFPAHDYFKDSDGDGQDSLYKICKVTLQSCRSPAILLKSRATGYVILFACVLLDTQAC